MNKEIYEYERVDVSLAANFRNKTIDTPRLREGVIIGGFIVLKGDKPNKIVNLTLQDNGGSAVFSGTDISDWEKVQGGGYLKGMKPFNIKSGVTYKLDFACTEDLDAPLTGQFIFVIEKNCKIN